MVLGKVRLSIVMVILTLIMAACGGTQVGSRSAEDYNQSPLTVTVPSGVDNSVVLSAAEAALEGRGWTIGTKTENEVNGALVHRDFDAKVKLKIDGGQLFIYSDSIYNGSRSDFVPTKGVPYGWLENLQTDISANLKQ